ncbi:TPM domain-containing protein [Duganella sp. LjRoot269]|uniref:TPM domain-containing protein n=1 Tax=Duganella sp. LjRoot269 TaxID=3342305 RepID=UPI003F4F7EA3
MRALSLARVLLLVCLLGWAVAAGAQVAVPPLSARVTDTTGTLTSDQKASLEQVLQDFEAKKGSQIGVLILASTAPETIEQYSLRVAEQWKLGRKKVDDGALLIVAKDDRTMRIEVGYGLEGVLNDAVCKRIISEVITPKFKQGDFYGGIRDGIDGMLRVVEGEPLPAPARPAADGGVGSYLPVLLVLALVVGGILRALLGRLPGAIMTGGLVAFLAWLFAGALSAAVIAGVLALFFTLVGGRALGMAGRHYGGGFGGGSGGFHGGGGSFGGGGASGRW